MDKKLEDVAHSFLLKKGWDTTRKLIINRVNVNIPGGISARISTGSEYIIYVDANSNYEKEFENTIKKSGIYIDNALEKNISSIIEHEFSHWNICPESLEATLSVMSGIMKGLKNYGMDEAKAKNLSFNVANMFFDTIVNFTLSVNNPEFAEGLYSHYINSCSNSNKSFLSSASIPKYFLLFLDSHAKFFGDVKNISSKVFEKYNKKNGDLIKPCQDLLGTVIGKSNAKRAIEGTLDINTKQQIKQEITNMYSWHNMAKDYAYVIAEYLKEETKQSIDNQMDLNSVLKKLRDDQDYADKAIKDLTEKLKKDLDDTVNLPKNEKETNKGSKDIERINRGLLSGIGSLPFDSLKIYDDLYKASAGLIALDFLDPKGEKVSVMTIARLGNKEIDKRECDFKDINWAKTLVRADGSISLHKKNIPINKEIKGSSKQGRYYNILFINDVSGSMDWMGTPFDKSKYDYTIRAIYATLNYLETKHYLQYIDTGMIQFSDNTSWTGWKQNSNLYDLRAKIFTGYQGGGTELDLSIFDKAMNSKTSKIPVLMLMLSDGEIQNGYEVASKLIETMKKDNNKLVVFEIQSSSSFAKQIKNAGGIVIKITDEKTLANIILNNVKSSYEESRPKLRW